MPLVQDPAGTGGTEKKQLPGLHSLWFAACSCCIFFDGLGLGLCVCQVSLSAASSPVHTPGAGSVLWYSCCIECIQHSPSISPTLHFQVCMDGPRPKGHGRTCTVPPLTLTPRCIPRWPTARPLLALSICRFGMQMYRSSKSSCRVSVRAPNASWWMAAPLSVRYWINLSCLRICIAARQCSLATSLEDAGVRSHDWLQVCKRDRGGGKPPRVEGDAIAARTTMLHNQGADKTEADNFARAVMPKVGAPRMLRTAAETHSDKIIKGLRGIAASIKLPHFSPSIVTSHNIPARPMMTSASSFTLVASRAVAPDKSHPVFLRSVPNKPTSGVILLNQTDAIPWLEEGSTASVPCALLVLGHNCSCTRPHDIPGLGS